MEKRRSSIKKKAPPALPAPSAPEPLVPEVVAEPTLPALRNIEDLLPISDITPQDLEVFKKKKADFLEAIQLKMIMEADQPLLRSIMLKKGFSDLESLDRIARLERGQATQNISIAVFDGRVSEAKERIAKLEALREELLKQEQANAVRDQKNEGGLQSLQPSGPKSKKPMSKKAAREQQKAIYANWKGK